jgi:hypothetical protein
MKPRAAIAIGPIAVGRTIRSERLLRPLRRA